MGILVELSFIIALALALIGGIWDIVKLKVPDIVILLFSLFLNFMITLGITSYLSYFGFIVMILCVVYIPRINKEQKYIKNVELIMLIQFLYSVIVMCIYSNKYIDFSYFSPAIIGFMIGALISTIVSLCIKDRRGKFEKDEDTGKIRRTKKMKIAMGLAYMLLCTLINIYIPAAYVAI